MSPAQTAVHTPVKPQRTAASFKQAVQNALFYVAFVLVTIVVVMPLNSIPETRRGSSVSPREIQSARFPRSARGNRGPERKLNGHGCPKTTVGRASADRKQQFSRSVLR